MVQFECPGYINLCVSFTFEEFPFPIFRSAASYLCSIKKWFIMVGVVKRW